MNKKKAIQPGKKKLPKKPVRQAKVGKFSDRMVRRGVTGAQFFNISSAQLGSMFGVGRSKPRRVRDVVAAQGEGSALAAGSQVSSSSAGTAAFAPVNFSSFGKRKSLQSYLNAPVVALATVSLLLLLNGSYTSIVVLLAGLGVGGLYFLYSMSTQVISFSEDFLKEHGRDIEMVNESDNAEKIADAMWSISACLHQWDARKFTTRDRQSAEQVLEMAVDRLAELKGEDAKRLRALFFPQNQSFDIK
ncbi:MAG: hypothetical protein PHC51_02820 [bacterium]|nr:hypothetical protein [bacterium]